MAYISAVTLESAPHSIDETAAAAIAPQHATEAAQVLLAASPAHARRFALAMHRRVSHGLDTNMIEHWARVVMEIGRITGGAGP
jgi:hypothetical protein